MIFLDASSAHRYLANPGACKLYCLLKRRKKQAKKRSKKYLSLFRNKFLTNFHSQFLPHILVIGIKTKQNTFWICKIKLSSKCNGYKAQMWYLWHSCLLFRKAPTFLLEIASDLDRRVLHPQIYCSGQLGQGQKCWSLKMETFVCGEKRNTGLENVSIFFRIFHFASLFSFCFISLFVINELALVLYKVHYRFYYFLVFSGK